MHIRFYFLLFLYPCLLLSNACSNKDNEADYIIFNGRIVDGTGNSWYRGEVAVKDGKIVAIGNLSELQAKKRIDAQNKIVAPGFIDVHGHIENSIFDRPTADNYIYDGVTTVITGNCGGSAENIDRFFQKIDSIHTSINIATLLGHNTIRKIAMGLDNRLATAKEQQKMDSIAELAMKDGAVGMSTGLIYLPGMYSSTNEVVAIAKVISKYHGVYASHIRNEENGVTDAINEALIIGRHANIPVQISHFKVSGRANWGRSKETLPMIDSARRAGIEVTIDQYPYTASSTNLGVRLPDWALSGGTDSLNKRIDDSTSHRRIVDDMLDLQEKYGYPDYSYAVVAMHKSDTTLNGKSISAINLQKGKKSTMNNEAETILELMKAGGAQMVYHSMNEEDVRAIIQYPFCLIGADAGVSDGSGMPHPRTYGTNARVLARYVREEKLITLEEAVRRMTSLAAQKFQLTDRGLLKPGYAADIVIFDENTITDRSTFEAPHQFSEGFLLVMVNGQPVLEKQKHTGLKSGMPLFGPAYIKSNN